MRHTLHPDVVERIRRIPTRLDRREFLAAMGALVAGAACGRPTSGQPPEAPVLADTPFTLGVASGDPTPTDVVLWTRLKGGDLPDDDVPVIWEVARDPEFTAVVTQGWEWASPELGHSVHADARGLRPGTVYFYRFRIGRQWTSDVGVTRTFPATDTSPERLRIGLASCQDYRDGYYNAHEHLADEEIEFLLFVGDYIYEDADEDEGIVRKHDGPDCFSVEEYRQRYEQYRSDQRLRELHRRHAWVMTWDDHEVRGNYAGTVHTRGDEDVLARRKAAYQAYYEHTPVRLEFALEDPANARIYRQLTYGDLVDLWVLDGRQYRTAQPCDGDQGRVCDGVYDEDATMLGDEQKQWLKETMEQSSARWKVLGQQTVFTLADFGGFVNNPDQWDGYRAERTELHEFFVEEEVGGLIVLTGDLHAAGFATLHADPEDDSTAVIGHEVVGTSLSSGTGNDPQVTGEFVTSAVDSVHYFNMTKRGYCVIEFTRDECRVDYRTVSTAREKSADLETDATVIIKRESAEFELQ